MTSSTNGPVERAVVIIPTYNEAANLRSIVARVREAAPTIDVLIADDNSPDGTGQIADDISAADSAVQVLHRPGKQGLGAAYLAGFAWAVDRGYQAVIEMDADGSHQPEELPRLLTALAEADVVLGSRWVPGGEVQNWPKSREFLSRGGSTYTRLALGIDVHDATGGFRAFRTSALNELNLDTVESQGYCFQIDLAWRAVRAGLRVREVPITFVERTAGQSKMSKSIVVEALWRVTAWGATHRWQQIRGVAQR